MSLLLAVPNKYINTMSSSLRTFNGLSDQMQRQNLSKAPFLCVDPESHTVYIKDDDQMLKSRIKQVMELTNKSSDEVAVALHDADNDINKAVNILLEAPSETIHQNEWKTTSSRKKKVNQASEVNGDNLKTKSSETIITKSTKNSNLNSSKTSLYKAKSNTDHKEEVIKDSKLNSEVTSQDHEKSKSSQILNKNSEKNDNKQTNDNSTYNNKNTISTYTEKYKYIPRDIHSHNGIPAKSKNAKDVENEINRQEPIEKTFIKSNHLSNRNNDKPFARQPYVRRPQPKNIFDNNDSFHTFTNRPHNFSGPLNSRYNKYNDDKRDFPNQYVLKRSFPSKEERPNSKPFQLHNENKFQQDSIPPRRGTYQNKYLRGNFGPHRPGFRGRVVGENTSLPRPHRSPNKSKPTQKPADDIKEWPLDKGDNEGWNENKDDNKPFWNDASFGEWAEVASKEVKKHEENIKKNQDSHKIPSDVKCLEINRNMDYTVASKSIDISELLGTSAPKHTTAHEDSSKYNPSISISETNRQASEAIKNAIGLGLHTTPSPKKLSHAKQEQAQAHMNNAKTYKVDSKFEVTEFGPHSPNKNHGTTTISNIKSKLPPLSKIPSIPVVMPDNHLPSPNQNFQFGSEFEFGSVDMFDVPASFHDNSQDMTSEPKGSLSSPKKPYGGHNQNRDKPKTEDDDGRHGRQIIKDHQHQPGGGNHSQNMSKGAGPKPSRNETIPHHRNAEGFGRNFTDRSNSFSRHTSFQRGNYRGGGRGESGRPYESKWRAPTGFHNIPTRGPNHDTLPRAPTTGDHRQGERRDASPDSQFTHVNHPGFHGENKQSRHHAVISTQHEASPKRVDSLALSSSNKDANITRTTLVQSSERLIITSPKEMAYTTNATSNPNSSAVASHSPPGPGYHGTAGSFAASTTIVTGTTGTIQFSTQGISNTVGNNKTTPTPIATISNLNRMPANFSPAFTPLLNHQYALGQALGLPYFPPPLYTFEDLQLLQRFPMAGFYDLSTQLSAAAAASALQQHTTAGPVHSMMANNSNASTNLNNNNNVASLLGQPNPFNPHHLTSMGPLLQAPQGSQQPQAAPAQGFPSFVYSTGAGGGPNASTSHNSSYNSNAAIPNSNQQLLMMNHLLPGMMNSLFIGGGAGASAGAGKPGPDLKPPHHPSGLVTVPSPLLQLESMMGAPHKYMGTGNAMSANDKRRLAQLQQSGQMHSPAEGQAEYLAAFQQAQLAATVAAQQQPSALPFMGATNPAFATGMGYYYPSGMIPGAIPQYPLTAVFPSMGGAQQNSSNMSQYQKTNSGNHATGSYGGSYLTGGDSQGSINDSTNRNYQKQNLAMGSSGNAGNSYIKPTHNSGLGGGVKTGPTNNTQPQQSHNGSAGTRTQHLNDVTEYSVKESATSKSQANAALMEKNAGMVGLNAYDILAALQQQHPEDGLHGKGTADSGSLNNNNQGEKYQGSTRSQNPYNQGTGQAGGPGPYGARKQQGSGQAGKGNASNGYDSSPPNPPGNNSHGMMMGAANSNNASTMYGQQQRPHQYAAYHHGAQTGGQQNHNHHMSTGGVGMQQQQQQQHSSFHRLTNGPIDGQSGGGGSGGNGNGLLMHPPTNPSAGNNSGAGNGPKPPNHYQQQASTNYPHHQQGANEQSHGYWN